MVAGTVVRRAAARLGLRVTMPFTARTTMVMVSATGNMVTADSAAACRSMWVMRMAMMMVVSMVMVMMGMPFRNLDNLLLALKAEKRARTDSEQGDKRN